MDKRGFAGTPQASATGKASDAGALEVDEHNREEYLFSGLQHNAKFQVNERLCVNLFEHFVDWTNVHCLNDSCQEPFPSRDWRAGRPRKGQRFVSSADDAQLIIHIPFNRKVKLMGISLGIHPDLVQHGPSVIHLYKDLPTFDFSDAVSVKPLHTLHLLPEDLCRSHESTAQPPKPENSGSKRGSSPFNSSTLGPIASARNLPPTAVPLPALLFGVTSSLWLFIEENQGGKDVTKISTMQVWGVPLQDMDVKHIRR
ncbi:UNVERIFIED_CONTAM: hypothetical protein HHA_247025 [Hammondia hammondi]|eukprot:XP_008883756.1 hypothetical protein HHA_247025 [Hammondia hammondi]